MRIAFIFDAGIKYPPDFNNMKCYYVTRELCRRGIGVTWLSIGERVSVREDDGIKFVEIRVPRLRFVWLLVSALKVTAYCRKERISVIYADDWLFMRSRILSKIFFQFIIRISGIFWVSDMRDPLLDFEIATGRVKEGSLSYFIKRVEEFLFYSLSTLIILPSEAYAKLMNERGIDRKRLIGIFRGIDRKLFTPNASMHKLRESLGINNSFVIGWFGIMQRYRLIDELLAPLAANLERIFPDSYLLIGGKGSRLESRKRLANGKISNRVIYAGTIPYNKMPEYIAACDLLLCPVSTKNRFSLFSAWLKIAEALAVGRPVVATRTFTSFVDFKDLRGVVWVGSTYEEFLNGIKWARQNFHKIKEEAMKQASDFHLYSIDRNIPKIVDAIVNAVEKNF
jgi:glycosyltransferase involved in cell wall biosynthesis